MKKNKKITRIFSYLLDIAYILILLPIMIVSIIIIYKSIRYPTKIPDVFGYKPFIILNGEMDEAIQYGDLAFTKIIDVDKLNIGDLIAYRNSKNHVILHQITEDNDTGDENSYFTVKTLEGEINENKLVKYDKVEGIFVKRIPKVGSVLLFFSSVKNLLIILTILVVIGLIAYFIAAKLDKNEQKKKDNIEIQDQKEKVKL